MKRTTTKKRASTTDAVEILHRRYYRGRPGREASLEVERINAAIARQIHAARTKAGLTQRELARLVGTTDSVISRLESADYAGHSLKMLQRISRALNYGLEVRLVPHAQRRSVPA
jgi:ribosome-binding protein aMBF1 (putative translation factor)